MKIPQPALLVALAAAACACASAQTAYLVNSDAQLFRVDLARPASLAVVAQLGFTPAAIDFLPGSRTLYALAVESSTGRIYTVDTATGATRPVGDGFPLKGAHYDLTGVTSFGFDFNPATLQADGSIRIRLTAANGANLRLHSATGAVAATDGAIKGSVTAAAYTNNAKAVTPKDGQTELFDIDTAAGTLALQSPPNDGVLAPVGPLGVTVSPAAAFDIHTSAAGVNTAYLVDPAGRNRSAVYTVDLKTGAATRIAELMADVSGGFALVP